MKNTLMHIVKMPAPIAIHDDLAAAVRARDWRTLSDRKMLLWQLDSAAEKEKEKEAKGEWTARVLHWAIQTTDVPCADIAYLLDDLKMPLNGFGSVGCSAVVGCTLLQRAIAANRLDVIDALIARGHQLHHSGAGCPVASHPLLTALHPSVEEGTFAALVARYSLPPALYPASAFYVPISRARMVALHAAGLDVRTLDCCAADAPALEYTCADCSTDASVARYLAHYLSVRNYPLCVFLARQIATPFAQPSLAADVLRADDAALITACIDPLRLRDDVVASGKSAMLLAAEAGADAAILALMAANVDGAVEARRASFFSLSTVTAHSVLAKRKSPLASQLAEYNARFAPKE